MAQLKDTIIDGTLEMTNDITLPNRMAINGIDTDGNTRENLQPCNQYNNCIIGYGNYTNDNGNTHIYGSAVRVITKDNDVTADGIQLARTDIATITSFSSGWANYGSNATTPTVRRYGKVVSLTGSLKNTSAITLNSSHVQVFTIPSGYRPHKILLFCAKVLVQINFVCRLRQMEQFGLEDMALLLSPLSLLVLGFLSM